MKRENDEKDSDDDGYGDECVKERLDKAKALIG